MRCFALFAAANLTALAAFADSIVLNGVAHGNVFIEEGASMYYVLLPDTGEVLNARKAGIAPADITFSPDSAAREALRRRWKEARQEANPALLPPAWEEPSHPAAEPGPVAPASDEPVIKTLRASGRATTQDAAETPVDPAYATDFTAGHSSLHNIPLGEALRAVLRQRNLDYRAAGNHLYISTPERLRRESGRAVQTHGFALNPGFSGTLPKIILRHQGIYGGGQDYGYGGRYGGGYGGGYGAYAGGAGAGPGYGGGFAGPAGFGGGYGGFGGGNRQDVTTISNISDLFSTIDDRMVGETPARPAELQIR